ncbi:hypothetical protein A0U89_15690 (plasmid) [Kozakia baliensis]|uniref:Uncharacterized protein n=1 Tax=Kozakia baliensis TaxID=153496 RepID=A0A1D8UYH1_9PROT|nr:hypothetical protein A0U89_15690 [Kozakia baliensis]GEL64972.1 hypothetical protein KBA01_22580 [Kozakia baliensis]
MSSNVKIKSLKWFMPIRTFTFWVIHLSTVTAVAISEQQIWFQPYHLWSWPIVFASAVVAYFISLPIEHTAIRLFKRQA